MTDDVARDEGADDEVPSAPRLPRREATARQALMAIALVFVIGVALGFVLAKTF
ncbi:MAG: hypothetical protein QOJ00_2447 [Actinomycetota bacterium]